MQRLLFGIFIGMLLSTTLNAQKTKQIAEVVVVDKQPTGREIINKVIKAIPKNYNQGPYTQRWLSTFKYRTDTGCYIKEVIEDYYDPDGYKGGKFLANQLQMFQADIARRTTLTDTLFNPIASSVVMQVYQEIRLTRYPDMSLDMVQFRNHTFLSRKHVNKYTFQLNGTVERNGQSLYRIAFKCSKPNWFSSLQNMPLSYSGEVLINKADYAVVEASGYSETDKKEIIPAFWPIDTNEIYYEKQFVSYVKTGKYYYPDKTLNTHNWYWGKTHQTTTGKSVSIIVEEGEQKDITGRISSHGEYYDPKAFQEIDEEAIKR